MGNDETSVQRGEKACEDVGRTGSRQRQLQVQRPWAQVSLEGQGGRKETTLVGI